jgi:hypothetical protein
MKLPKPIQDAVDRLRKLLEKVDPRLLISLGGVAAGVFLLWAFTAGPFSGDDVGEAETKVVTVAVETDDAADAPVGPLGFPLVATRNTTRVGGEDAAVDAAAVALATHPSSAASDPVEAAILVGPEDWQAGIAASVLAGPPIRAAILVGESGGVPEVTADALAKLNPQGSGPGEAAVYTIGDVSAPKGYRTQSLPGGSPAEAANSIDQLRQTLIKTDPARILIASADQAPYAMPAAAWAARSGDPVLFVEQDAVPEQTVEALQRHRGTPIYLLGPESVISAQAEREVERVSPGVQRVGEEGPTANSIAFARYSDAGFGWNINDPGHGLVLASANRPLDAGAAASLSASGKWGPLLVLEDGSTLPPELRSFLLDIKPGYEDDPTRAVYNHVWVIGDSSVIGARVQADVDELAEVTEVGAGAGGPIEESTGSSSTGSAPPNHDEPEAEPQGQGQGGGKP